MCLSNIEFKDIVTPIILIATIFSSHWLASKQARKTKKAKWIEDFRFEVAKFLSLSNLISSSDIKALHDLSTSGYVILMLLSDRNKKHQALINEVASFGIFSTQFNSTKLTEYEKRIAVIKDSAKEIINAEERKL
ncbi:hypothetical protein [Mucilaginibacter dorajii]|uniref:Uncharacterized protein n=1 Tax=Mucilaginibacter dorajii TaxID=692994 RepID=A0ABP7QU39_9SPHI|nr:hypothetical protein [Mucilaginibacter dorajii]MCS3735798.1 hypothetical protein [Mucilaginibacter dorajii]